MWPRNSTGLTIIIFVFVLYCIVSKNAMLNLRCVNIGSGKQRRIVGVGEVF